MKKQFAALLALSTAAACVLSYQPVQAGAESVLGSMTQENLTDITNEQKDAFYQSSLGEIEPSAEPSELEQAATANGMYKDTFSFTNHSCNLSGDDFNQKVFEPIWNSMTNIERLAYLNKSSVYRNVCQGRQCFGMAALSILVHNGELSPSDIQAGAETLHDITQTNDVEQLISYYDMLLEYQAVSNVVMYAPTLLTQDERVDNLLNCAERCKEKGTYFMVAIRAGGTHMIVGMDKVSGSWTFDGVNYDTCIVAYDSNFYNKTTKESLFNDNACIYVNSKTKQFCTDEDYLQTFARKHRIVDLILEYRGVKKLLSTYVEALPQLVNRTTGRIHTSFNQAVTATGRLSSTNPNLQNIPVREEMGRRIRRAFIPSDSDHLLLSADYSQVELRLMAHLSGDESLIAAFAHGEDIHAATAAKLFNKTLDEVTSEERRRAKTANFGIIYGISAFGLSQRLEIPRKEAKDIIDGYFESYPKVKEYMDDVVAKAKEEGFVSTIFGRRRYLNDISSHNAVARGLAERNAVNAPIQGSAADIMKIAMINVHRRFAAEGIRSKVILQVHDELVVDMLRSEQERVAAIVTECMESAAALKVRLVVDYGVGDNWLEAH